MVSQVSTAASPADANGDVLSQAEKGHEKEKTITPEPTVIETEDNWIARFLYGGPIGYTVNFSLLIAATAYLVITLQSSDEFYKKQVEPFWLASVMQFFSIVIPLDIFLCFFVVLTLPPLSRRLRSTCSRWIVGLTFSVIIFVAIWLVRDYANLGSRIMLFVDWARLSMKITAFLVECSWSDRVRDKSSMKSFFYFLWIPTLVYKNEYQVARAIRWIKVLSHFWWILGAGCGALNLFVYHWLPFAKVDLLTIDLKSLISIGVVGGAAGGIFYPIVIWFFIFENFCGLHGELLRYPHLKVFGDLKEVLSGRDPLTHFNTIASRWFSRYVYVPILKTSGSRVKAMWLTMILSLVVHDVSYYYIGDVILLASPLLNLTIIPLFLTLQPKKKFHKLFMGLVIIGGVSFIAVAYVCEFLAWNYSSQPHLESVSKIRLVPLFVIQLYRNFQPKLYCLLTSCE